MPQILVIEIAALLLAAVGNSVADSLYFSGRLSPRMHALWVSSSTAAMCVPLAAWVVPIFVGPGAVADALVAAFVVVLFTALYRQLRAAPATRRAGYPPLPAAENVPPSAGG